jgi:hypothetical protein
MHSKEGIRVIARSELSFSCTRLVEKAVMQGSSLLKPAVLFITPRIRNGAGAGPNRFWPAAFRIQFFDDYHLAVLSWTVASPIAGFIVFFRSVISFLLFSFLIIISIL